MRNARQALLISAAAITLLAGGALAQYDPGSSSGGNTAQQPYPSASPGTPSSSSSAGAPSRPTGGMPIVGLDVRTSQNQDVGKINNVVVSPDGKVNKLVVSMGGVLGIGGKQVALNWNDVHIDRVSHQAIVSMSKDQLKSAPGFSNKKGTSSTGGTSPSRGSGATPLGAPR